MCVEDGVGHFVCVCGRWCRTFCACVEGGIGDFVCVCGGGGGHFVSDKVGCVSMHVYLCVLYCT